MCNLGCNLLGYVMWAWHACGMCWWSFIIPNRLISSYIAPLYVDSMWATGGNLRAMFLATLFSQIHSTYYTPQPIALVPVDRVCLSVLEYLALNFFLLSFVCHLKKNQDPAGIWTQDLICSQTLLPTELLVDPDSRGMKGMIIQMINFKSSCFTSLYICMCILD